MTSSQDLPAPQSQLSAWCRSSAIESASACSAPRVAVGLAEGAEVAAQRAREQALLVAAHRGRGDELVERRVARPAARRPPRLHAGRPGAPVPEPAGSSSSSISGRGAEPACPRSTATTACVVERAVVRRELGERERPEQGAERLAAPDGRRPPAFAASGDAAERAARPRSERGAALDHLALAIGACGATART